MNSCIYVKKRAHLALQKHMGGTPSVTGFYRTSHNPSDMAQYFGGGQATDEGSQNGTITVSGTAHTTGRQYTQS